MTDPDAGTDADTGRSRSMFGSPASWSFGLGLLAGAIGGTVVPSSGPVRELQHVAGLTLLFVPTIYALIDYRAAAWERKHPYVRFAVFTLSMTAASAVLVGLVALAIPGPPVLERAGTFLGAVAGFAVAAWATFFGGAELLWARFLDRFDVEW